MGHYIENGNIVPIERSIEFASKFSDEIKDKRQLKRFLESLNYLTNFYQNIAQDTSILYFRLKKNPFPWTDLQTEAVKKIKFRAKYLPCPSLVNPEWYKIVEINASNKGYEGILNKRSEFQ